MYTHRILTGSTICALLFLGGTQAFAETPKDKDGPHGFLGVQVSPEKTDKGVQVRDVAADSPAAKAGLQKGDIVVSVNDHKVADKESFMRTMSALKPGDKATIKVLRDGQEQTLTATLGTLPKPPVGLSYPFPPLPAPPTPRHTAALGVRTDELTPDMKKRLNVAADTGAVITEVLPDSPAAKAGLKKDDVITSINDKAIKNHEELREAIMHQTPGKEVAVQLQRGQERMTVKATLQDADRVIPGAEESSFPFPASPLDQMQKIRDLERQVQTLEKRLNELEKKQNREEK